MPVQDVDVGIQDHQLAREVQPHAEVGVRPGAAVVREVEKAGAGQSAHANHGVVRRKTVARPREPVGGRQRSGAILVGDAAGDVVAKTRERLEVPLDQVRGNLVVIVDEEQELAAGGGDPGVARRALPRTVQLQELDRQIGELLQEIGAASIPGRLVDDHDLEGRHGLRSQLVEKRLEVRISIDRRDQDRHRSTGRPSVPRPPDSRGTVVAPAGGGWRVTRRAAARSSPRGAQPTSRARKSAQRIQRRPKR